MSDKAREEKFVKISERRDKSAMRLNQVLPNYFNSLEKDDKIHPSDLERIKDLKSLLKKKDLLPTDLLQFRDIFKRYADFKFFSVKDLMRVGYFMSLEPVTGVNIINNLL